MKSSILFAFTLSLSLPAWAQAQSEAATSTEEAEATEALLSAEPRPADELPEKVTLPPPVEQAPAVKIRTVDNGDVVEEYRVNGRLTMVKVKPRNAPEYTLLDTNGDGRLDKKDAEGPVAPVYWTLYEWN
ncbi:DUF2782 domain-containing protein [Pseudomarimonas arenosa]|uniref:DUF2782 domain-containing protein n=1 Tax=Pseudomarimonas arenosa TaxID=2774145 RepID=A0AAW3ZT34_9GAMM|nr:DUF2782 domain-containing protein [Pseudomarimonas arenosa]MBD8528167.1 DUF2782 domain-containing protein [Pseudomarimonas arenosa]